MTTKDADITTIEGEVLPPQDKLAERMADDFDIMRHRLLESMGLLQGGKITPEQAQQIAKAAGRTLADLQVELRRRAAQERRETTAKPEPRRIRLTKSAVRALPVPRDRMAIYWDKDTTGLGVRISPAGRKTYFLQARTKIGRGVKITLGRADLITAEQARDRAKEHLAAIELDRDPAAERKAARQAERERRGAPTVEALWETFEKDYLPGKRPKTQACYRGWFQRHIRPALGRKKLIDLTDRHIDDLYQAITREVSASTANRCHATLSAMLEFAKRRKLVAANVCRGAIEEHHREEGRERTLSDEELRALVGHLAASQDLEARLVEFLLATGSRRGETLAMRWSDISGSSWWTIPASVSKSRKLVRRPLNKTAIAALEKVERRGGGLVFNTTEHRLAGWWQRARKSLGMPDLRLHDLRHVYASLAISGGASLATVGKLLGHGVASQAVTTRYAHLADQPQVEGATLVSDRLIAALRDAEPAGSA